MKKILALLCGLTFASGAWAYEYDFTLEIAKVPKEMGGMNGTAKWMLVDTAHAGGPVVLAYGLVSTLQDPETRDVTQSGDAQIITYKGDKITHSGERIYTGSEYGELSVVDHTLTAEKITNTQPGVFGDAYRDVKFEFSVETADATISGKSPGDVGTWDGLVGIIYDPGSETIESSYQVFDKITYNSVYTGTSLKGSRLYAVPEPTSGLLLLLGVAGLALRRKRAA